ncbi:hypothetical protein Dda_8986 [Drechslerella dactyloides]|uniref:Uncharacterized protein n=1 Tax=Drechslerella dactyloides TaxID=74499 RepID=A0AAD6NEM3_DREDA|nr:hypothetical protein Dda_8986 [Drechslerella dactyloides]
MLTPTDDEIKYESKNAELWNALLGTAEVGVIQKMLNTYHHGLRDAFISDIHLRITKPTTSSDAYSDDQTADILIELEIPSLESDPSHFEHDLVPNIAITIHPAFEILEGTTYNYVPDAAQSPAPTYQNFVIPCVTVDGSNLSFRFATSGVENHLVVVDAPTDSVTDTILLGDILYDVWTKAHGIYVPVQDFTFMAVRENTKSIINDTMDKKHLRETDILFLDCLEESDREFLKPFWVTSESGALKGEPMLLIRLTSDLPEDEDEEESNLTVWTETIEKGIKLHVSMNIAASWQPNSKSDLVDLGVIDEGVPNPALSLIRSAREAALSKGLGIQETGGIFRMLEEEGSEILHGDRVTVDRTLYLVASPKIGHIAIGGDLEDYMRWTDGSLHSFSDILHATWAQLIKGSAEDLTKAARRDGFYMPRYFSILEVGLETQAVLMEIFLHNNLRYEDTLWLSHSVMMSQDTSNLKMSTWLAVLGTAEISVIEEMNIKFARDIDGQRVTSVYIRWTTGDPHRKNGVPIPWIKHPEVLIICEPQRTILKPWIDKHASSQTLVDALTLGGRLEMEGLVLRDMAVRGRNELFLGQKLGKTQLAIDRDCPEEVAALFENSQMKLRTPQDEEEQYYLVRVEPRDNSYVAFLSVSRLDRHLVLKIVTSFSGFIESLRIEDYVKVLSRTYIEAWKDYSSEVSMKPPQEESARWMERHFLRGVSILQVCKYTEKIIGQIDKQKILTTKGYMMVDSGSSQYTNDIESKAVFQALLGTPEIGGVQLMTMEYWDRVYRAAIGSILIRLNPDTRGIEILVQLKFSDLESSNRDSEWLQTLQD